MNELYDVVDKFFIVEMVRAHNQFFDAKPLAWEHVKHQPRFEKLRDKVVHFVLDDLDVAKVIATGSKSKWIVESYMEGNRWRLIKEWNNKTGFFGPDDVIGFGDTDEIASRQNVHSIKHCAFKSPAIDIGIWFPFGRLDTAFRTDFPVRGHPYTLGDPTYWSFSAAESHKGTPSRTRGKSASFLLGGIHMTHYNYMPYHLVKGSAATEAISNFDTSRKAVERVVDAWHNDKLQELEDTFREGVLKNSRVKKLSQISPGQLKGIVYLPWFYDCNRDRYPRWEGKPDSRLGLSDKVVA